MSELSKYLVEQILLTEEELKNFVVVYSGRFQPFHKGHFATYQGLVKKFGKDKVYIGTSNKTDNQKSPFNFKEKKTIMTKMFGIPLNKIVEVKNPYAPTEILKDFDETTTGFITVVGEKDEQRLGGKYFEKYKGKIEAGYKDKGYVYASPAQPNAVSGTDVRNWLSKGSDEEKRKNFLKAYPKFDETIYKFITLKLAKLGEGFPGGVGVGLSLPGGYINGAPNPEDVKKTRKQLDKEDDINEDLKWEEDTYKKCMLGKLPLSLNIVKKLVDPIRTTSLHSTDVENLSNVVALQGTKKSISTFNKTSKYGKLVQGNGMHTKGGIIVALSGVVLAQSIMDLWTEPDKQGRRWVEPGTIIDGLGRERDVVFNFAPELKKYKENWKQHSFDGTITNAEKAEFIKKYYDAAEKYMLSKKKEFQDQYLNSNKLYYDSDWNEVVLTDIKIEKILAIPSNWSDDEVENEKTLKQLKQKYKNVQVADKESEIQNFIKQNGGTIKESVNEISDSKKKLNTLFKKHNIKPATYTASNQVRGFGSTSQGYKYERKGLVSLYGVDKDIVKKIADEAKEIGVRISAVYPDGFDFHESVNEDITLNVKVGDTVLMGKFKNKKVVVKSIGKDEHGMPTINGKKATTFRILPKQNVFKEIASTLGGDDSQPDGGYLPKGKKRVLGGDDGVNMSDEWFTRGGYTQTDFPKADAIYTSDDENQYSFKIKSKNNARADFEATTYPYAPTDIDVTKPVEKIKVKKTKTKKKDIVEELVGEYSQLLDLLEGTNDDDKYVHIGYGKYKEKGKEKDQNAPTFEKDDSGKYIELKSDKSKQKPKPTGQAIQGADMFKHDKSVKQEPKKSTEDWTSGKDGWEILDDDRAKVKNIRDYTDEEYQGETGEYFENDVTKNVAPNAFKNEADMIQKMKAAKPIYLSSEEMQNMGNTDVGEILSASEEGGSDAMKARGKELADEYGKDWNRLEQGIQKGNNVPSPIALRDKNGNLHLVAGNTRLMSFTAYGKKLPVKVIDYNGEFNKNEEPTDGGADISKYGIKNLKRKISGWAEKEKAFFEKHQDKPKSETRRSIAEALKDKTKGARHAIVHGFKHEAHLFKTAASGVKNWASGGNVSDEEKKALYGVAKKVVIATALGVATGGLSHGVLPFAQHLAAEFVPHIVAETLLVGGVKSALFADVNEEERLLTAFMDKIADGIENMEIPNDVMKKAIDSYNEKQNVSEMSKSQLNQIEKYAEKQLSPEDIEFTKHFFDRVNDTRNGKEISEPELTGFFKRLARHKKEFKEFLEKYQQIVVKDKRYDINIPFVRQANQIIAKTVMRKDDFKTSNPTLSVEIAVQVDRIPGGLAKGLSLNDIAKKHDVSIKDITDEFKKGYKVEREHTTDTEMATEIAMDHLFEDPQYYTKLASVEEDRVPQNFFSFGTGWDYHTAIGTNPNKYRGKANFPTKNSGQPDLDDEDEDDDVNEIGIGTGQNGIRPEYPKGDKLSDRMKDVEKARQQTKSDKEYQYKKLKEAFTKGQLYAGNLKIGGVVVPIEVELIGADNKSKEFITKIIHIDKKYQHKLPIDGTLRIPARIFRFTGGWRKIKTPSAFESVISEISAMGDGASFQNDGNSTTGYAWNADWNDYDDQGYYLDNLPDWTTISDKPSEYEKKKATDQTLPVDAHDDGKTSKYNRILKQNFKEPHEFLKTADVKLTEAIINEGGAYGHMNHPFDTEINLTFGQLKDIVNRALDGNLELTREKTDGQALAISWVNGKLVAARNKSHLANRGANALDISGVATKFAGRGELEKAYNFAMQDLTKAIKSLSDKQKEKIFKNGACFMNIEVIYPTSVNVIPYGQPLLVFHGTMEYDMNGNAIGEDAEAGRILGGMVKQVEQHVQDNYTLQGPPVLKLPKSQDLSSKKPKYLAKISKLQKEFGLSDTAGVAEYHQAWWENFVDKKSPSILDNNIKIGLVKRWAFGEKGFRIDKNTITDEKTLAWATKIDKEDHKGITKDNLMKFEDIFLGVGAEVLSFTASVLTVNPDKAVRDMKKRLEQTIKDVEASGDPKKIEKLKLELKRLNAIGGPDKIVPIEGIVFIYNGQTFKLTGAFASLNQLLGIFY